MSEHLTLGEYLATQSGPQARVVTATVQAIAEAAQELAERVSLGVLAGAMGDMHGGRNSDGDAQKQLDVEAHELFLRRLRGAPVAAIASEESDHPEVLQPDAPLVVAIDPLDGSSNIDTNVSIGTIFSILPALEDLPQSFLQAGNQQLGAGFVVYGPQTALVLSLLNGTSVFVLDRRRNVFVLSHARLELPAGTREYAINASNYRHWNAPVRAFVDDCLQGTDGPRGRDFNMRWIASLVADTYRILMRGGVFLYPADRRPSYRHGRLRLVYEANPVALLVEQAGGAASDGVRRILDIEPEQLHQRIPLVFGSADKVERVRRYHLDPIQSTQGWPLFARRGLLRG